MIRNMWPLPASLKHHFRMAACAASAALMLCAPAKAADLDDFHRAIETAMSHHRVASGYLRTGNIDLAMLEIEGLREAWAKVSTLPRPAAFRDPQRYTGTMLDIAAQLVGTTLVLNMGRADVARESLEKIRKSLSGLRRDNGVTVLADCVLDANTSLDILFALDDKPPSWDTAAVADITAKSEAYRATLQRCDGMAPPAVRRHAEFRRLIDGALASLAQFPVAIVTRDRDLLHRLLGELRSFDNLLAFRYG
jgi:hypothetical protein